MCLITPFKDKKVATEDMIVYKGLYHMSPKIKTIVVKEKRWWRKEVTEEKTVEMFSSEHEGYSYESGLLQPKVEMGEDNSWRASSSHEWGKAAKYLNEKLGRKDIMDFEVRMHHREHFVCIGAGYHSGDLETIKILKQEAWGGGALDVVKCIIPKGSEYYEGFGLYVSDQIIVTGEIAE
jgi:hypothetical protein